jgi:hypothetical protein
MPHISTAAARGNPDAATTLTLLNTALTCVVTGFAIGFAFIAKDIVEVSQIRAQISQIDTFDAATADFFDKFDGLPGDLLAVSADRAGLVAGSGAPANSDGDGKISPCSPGWQWNLGCETALFWSQLAGAEFLPDNFSADNTLYDRRLGAASTVAPYLPHSPIDSDVYITVWNSDAAQASPLPRLPYGNYYEISRIEGVMEGKIIDNAGALSPLEARMIDEKIDDGAPLSGRVVVNGNATWPEDAWGTFAKSGVNSCVSPEHGYNSYEYFKAHRPLCHLAIAFRCCTRQKDDY